jgi:predicted MFS family arabinose efflux permease
MFLTAGDVLTLTAARIAQGIATGAAVTALGATLVDLDPPHDRGRAGMVNSVAPVGGLAVGALGCGALVQYAPGPTHLIYAILLGGMVFAALVVAFLPETSSRRPGALASLRPRLRIPARLRSQVLSLVPILAASWALGGLYLSLGPSVAASLFGLHSHLVGGLVVTLLCSVGALTSFLLRTRPVGWLLSLAGGTLAAGMATTLTGVESTTVGLAAAGTVIAGVGFGAAALGCFGTLARLAAPHERGELFAVAYVISYVAFSVPAVVAGLASTRYGLHETVVVYAVVVIALCVSALVSRRVLAARQGLPAATQVAG